MSITRSRILSVALALSATIVTLYAIETILTVARPSWIDKLGTALKRGPDVVTETKLLRDQGIRAYPYLQPDTFTDSLHKGLGIGGDTTVVPSRGFRANSQFSAAKAVQRLATAATRWDSAT